MKTLNYLFILLASLILIACSPDNNTAKTKLFEEQRSALEKAKGIEKTLEQQSKETQQSVEKQTQ